jgi:hypothetical protein
MPSMLALFLEVLLWQIPLSGMAAGIATANLIAANTISPPTVVLCCLYFILAWLISACIVLTADLFVLLLVFMVIRVLGVMLP